MPPPGASSLDQVLQRFTLTFNIGSNKMFGTFSKKSKTAFAIKDASLEVCATACASNSDCKGFVWRVNSSNGQAFCKGLKSLGNSKGKKESVVVSFSYAKL